MVENDVKQSDSEKPAITTGKPLQTLSYTKKDKEWRKQNVEYFIRTAAVNIDGKGFQQSGQTGGFLNEEVGVMQDWFNAYNNRIPQKLFDYVTNPLNATNDLYKKFPAKIRPLNILRPTVDLLVGEFCKRPFKFDVVNMDGEGVMNSYLENKYSTWKKNVTNRLAYEIQKAKGQEPTQKNIPDPSTVMDDFNSNYKDLIAAKGYKALKLIESDFNLKEFFTEQIKLYIISGQVVSLKNIKRSTINFDKVSPKWVSINKAPGERYFEDASDGVVKFRLTVADLVDIFYEELKEADLIKLEQSEDTYRRGLYNFFATVGGSPDETIAKVDLFYCTWKSRKKIGFLSYSDPFTGERLTTEVDEEYKVDKDAGEEVEWEWVNEAWEGWRINDEYYIGIQPIAVQRNELNNFSSCKLPINGRRFSDTEAQNISIMALGMPYQIMYMIINYRIELTIARSKGKIFIMDKNTVPDDGAEGEEKFLYYSEALGYMMIDRDQDGVDRSWNQYGSHDMSLFEHIEQLIKIAQYYKDSWEELMGISRQRKGDIAASDGLGTANEAIFRSSVISELLFQGFDEYIQTELQGLLDLSKFAWIDGKMGYYRNDDGRMELFQIDGEEHATSNLGVYCQFPSQTQGKLSMLQQQINAIAQRKDVKISTIADLIFTDSYAELKNKLKKAEAIEAQIIQQQAQSEQEAKKELEAMKKEYAEFQNYLDIQKQEREWDRKDNNTILQGEIQGRIAKEPSGYDMDVTAIIAESNDRLNNMQKTSTERMAIQSSERIAKMKDKTENKKIAASLKNPVAGEK